MNTLVLDQDDNPTDVYQKLSEDRILFLYGELTENLATDLVAELILKDQESKTDKITIFINSSGGEVRNVFMVYDAMKMISAPIETICIGEASDEVVLILAAGSKRMATKNSIITLSELKESFECYDSLPNHKINFNKFKMDNKRFLTELENCTSKNLIKSLNKTLFLQPEKAKTLKIIDSILNSKKEVV